MVKIMWDSDSEVRKFRTPDSSDFKLKPGLQGDSDSNSVSDSTPLVLNTDGNLPLVCNFFPLKTLKHMLMLLQCQVQCSGVYLHKG